MPIINKSGGGPFYKTGPLYIHGESHDGDPTDPKDKTKAKAKAKAEKKASEAPRVYGKPTTTRTTDDSGVTTVTKTIPYTQSGKGTAGIDLGPDFKPTAEQTRKANLAKAEAEKKGVITRSYKTFKLEKKGIDFTPQLPTASIDIKKPVTPKPSMPSYSFSMKKQSGTTLVDKKLPSKSNLARKTKTKGGSCGCKY
jgi:hypothetical protein